MGLAGTAKKQHSSAARAEADLVKWGTVGKLLSLRSHLLCDIDRSGLLFRYGSWRTQARSFEIARVLVESIGFTVFLKFRGGPIINFNRFPNRSGNLVCLITFNFLISKKNSGGSLTRAYLLYGQINDQ